MNIKLTAPPSPFQTSRTPWSKWQSSRLLLSFIVSFGLSFVSGLYYYFVPHSLNWTASQLLLIVHLSGGLLAFLLVIPFTIAHQRAIEQRSLLLLAPWLAFRARPGETSTHRRFRLIGHALYWSLMLLTLSGVVLTVPAVLWLFGLVWLPGYLAYQVGNAVHLGITFIAVGLIFLHVGRRMFARRR